MPRIALRTAWLALFLVAACALPHHAAKSTAPVHSFLDVPLSEVRSHIDQYHGALFEGRVKYYHTYHSRADVERYYPNNSRPDTDPAKRMQVVLGKTHFTARPIQQYANVIQIQITHAQDQDLIRRHVERQDVLNCRLRVDRIAPGGALAFDLVEILD